MEDIDNRFSAVPSASAPARFFRGLWRNSKLFVWLSLLVAFFALLIAINLLASWFGLGENRIIKTSASSVSAIVAGGEPVKWSVLVRQSDIDRGVSLLSLPRGAKITKLSVVSATEAKTRKKVTNAPAPSLSTRVAWADERALASSEKTSFLASIRMATLGLASAIGSETISTPTIVNLSDHQPRYCWLFKFSSHLSAYFGCGQVLGESIGPVEGEAPAEAPAEEADDAPADSADDDTDAPTEEVETETPASAEEEESADSAETPADNDAPAQGSSESNADLPAQAGSSPTDSSSSDVIVSEANQSESESDSEIASSTRNDNADAGEATSSNPSASDTQSTDATDSEPASSTIHLIDDSATSTATSTDLVQVDFETPAPTVTEEETSRGKLVTISAEGESANCGRDADLPAQAGAGIQGSTTDSTNTATVCLTNVLASTKIPEIYKVGQEDKIHLKWKNEGDQDVTFHAYDTNGNGKLDYVEWTVPHLSEQIFEIIFISKAFELDADLSIVGDIYEQVGTQDQTYVAVPAGHYVRATFEQTLNNGKDITIFARPSLREGVPADEAISLQVEVFPVYTDAEGNQTQGPQLTLQNDGQNPDFTNIDHDGKYRVLLSNLSTPTDVFDLRIVSLREGVPADEAISGLDFDYIVDPTPATVSDSFTDTSKVSATTSVTVDTANGQVALSTATTWACGTAITDARDGKVYNTVLIDSQCWMQQNLNVGTMITGVAGSNQGTSCASIQKYCYNDEEANCGTYGALYQWNQAMCGGTTVPATGICPAGWHLPTHDEWTLLELTTCTSGSCATDFPYNITTTGWKGTNEGTTLKNPAGSFRGLLAGYRGTGGGFFLVGSYGDFWSSVQSGTSAWYRFLFSGYASVDRTTIAKTDGFSVRCVKD